MSALIGTLVGNPRPASRTLNAALALRAALRQVLPSAEDGAVVDAAELAQDVFTPGSTSVKDALASLERSTVLVVASPTYKATYTGLLKAVLDQAPGGWLKGRIAIPLQVAASDKHALAAELHLRPVLVELGAHVPGPAVFLNEAVLADHDALIATLAQHLVDTGTAAVVRAALAAGASG
ncbi:NADPH-dependent FMN reductase [Umezawaea endophytica]|uniref:NAD(P)H-dependent oxidoreductase n=1 Tax=Umezawaea endophytica TaxID=1654476 RepID=A0A9X3A4S3_9PSEU|nr:NAD(P)H-dependent oxidoreductase [Umezawaea endophytica]MCS7481558.1 NAD(P)H-dependent oxidoreductase [Umezawaea endophytica]